MIRKYIEAATWGTVDMFSMMMGLEGQVLTADELKNLPEYYITGIINFYSETARGMICVRFSQEMAVNFVAAMMGMDPGEVDMETLIDGVGEMANIAAGQVKTTIETDDPSFTISLPSIITGNKHGVDHFHSQIKERNYIRTDHGVAEIMVELSA